MIDQVWFLAFVITPALVIAGGYLAVRLHERDLRLDSRRHPAE